MSVEKGSAVEIRMKPKQNVENGSVVVEHGDVNGIVVEENVRLVPERGDMNGTVEEHYPNGRSPQKEATSSQSRSEDIKSASQPLVTQDKQFTSRTEYMKFLKNMEFHDLCKPKHQNGPDYIIPSSSHIAWEPEAAVRLRIGTSGRNAQTPCSVVTLLRRPATKYPDLPALSLTRNGVTRTWTFKQYHQDVCTAAKGFLKLGLRPLHSVAIMGFNSPEWYISDLAAIFAGGIATGIYSTNSAQECFHILEDSRANIVVVEDTKQLAKILPFRDRLPNLKAIIQWIGEPTEQNVLKWTDLMEIGETVPSDILDTRIRGIAVNQCCTLIYTSGTTGRSKGVMLTHDNLTYMDQLLADTHKIVHTKERWVSFLPLSHIAAQGSELYAGITCASCVYFAQPDALKGSLRKTLLEVRPTRLLCVPRVFEKMHDAMRAKEAEMGAVGRGILKVAKKIGYQQAVRSNKGQSLFPLSSALHVAFSASLLWFYGRVSADSPSLGLKIGAALAGFNIIRCTVLPISYSMASVVLRKARRAVGLDKCKSLLSAGAPISREYIEYFHSFNFMIREVYGMSEAMLQTMNMEGATKFGTVGQTADSYETRLHDQDSTGEGDICVRGRHVCMGYLNMKEKTMETIDSAGWLHSGDLGRLDEEGYLTITGRIKELLITAGGENVAPVPIEERIKKELPIVSNVVVVGDMKKFLCVLLTLAVEVDPNSGLPTDKLTAAVRSWCKNMNNDSTTVQQLITSINKPMSESIQAAIDRANQKAISNAQRIQKWTVLPTEFSVATGELGPTLKLKRQVITKKFKDNIDVLYQ